MKIVLDTNVLVSAARSRQGVCFSLLSQLPTELFDIVITVPLYLEYQDALLRPEIMQKRYTPEEIIGFTRYLASIAHRQPIYFLWRPWLRDPKDDMVLEAALASGSKYIVTGNLRDFQNQGIEENLGIYPISPRNFISKLGISQ